MGVPQAISSSNFIAELKENCIRCKNCVSVCPVGCFTVEKNESKDKVIFDDTLCLGCGVCKRVCKVSAIEMVKCEKRIFTPVNTVHKLVLEAIETDTLHNLIFDNQAMSSHKFMAAFTGAFLRLTPVKQLLVSEKFQSKYLVKLIENIKV
jgi:Pyruvate/2-oxoacid:ferredoxin oxidoreductase delta subunit